jgi:soluble epoxide hydrolase/lipid-phosphate phosphatase
MVIWRTVLYHPGFVSHVFSVCTPYDTPKKQYISIEDLVNGPAPQFGYQLHLASGEVEKRIKSRDDIRRFLCGMFGGMTPDNQLLFSPRKGIRFENLSKIEGPCLMGEEVSLLLQLET